MKPSLNETERVFFEAITYPTGVQDYLNQTDPHSVSVFNSVFAETPTFGRIERVTVYAEAYFFRLRDVLAEQFPMVLWLLGPERFHNLITDFILSHPSQNPNLRRLGDPLPRFLEAHPLGQKHPEAAEFAPIELAIDRALDAEDSSVLTREAMAGVPPGNWPEMRLTFCSSLALHQTHWNFRLLRDAHRAAERPPALSPASAPLTVCVWRKGLTVFTKQLATGEAALIRSLQAGRSFGVASAAAAEHGVDASGLVQILSRWLEDELLAEVEVSSAP